jgi:hypothetical protein
VLDGRYRPLMVGEATTITTEGVLVGRSAPKFMTRIFPGLNLTRYRYSKMTGFAEYREDGVAVNDMIFDGKLYDMYIHGTTDRGNIGRYTVGLVLLGSRASPQWHHAWRQGRLPILKVKARIEGGKMHDEEISYPWPNETLGEIFIRNNIVYRAWLNSGKN